MIKPLSLPTCVILAGGIGKNFAPLITNKTIFPFFNKPLVAHLIEQLQRVGFKRIIVATNNENHDVIQNLSIEGLELTAIKQLHPLGMADAMLSLERKIDNKPILVMNAVDVVDDSLLQDIAHQSQTGKYDGLITGIEMETYFPGGYLKVDSDFVSGIVEKPKPGMEPSQYVNLVFHYFRDPATFFSYLHQQPSDADDAYEQALNQMVKSYKFGLVKYSKYWNKLKYPHFVLDLMNIFLTHRLQPSIHPSAAIAKNVVLEGPILIESGVKIAEGAVIKGPAYIGPNCIIGSHVLARQSIIERNTTIGFGSEIARSYIGPECALHHNFIGDSILESGVNPSYGTTTANWRFDNSSAAVKSPGGSIPTSRDKFGAILAKGVKCGVNVSLMPGVCIGANSIVYPGQVVYKSLSSNSVFGRKN